jgi:superfamily II helicase
MPENDSNILFPDNLERLSMLERAQQLHDATMRRHAVWHQEHLERLSWYEALHLDHTRRIDRLEELLLQQQALTREVLALQERFSHRQDDQVTRQADLAAHQRDHAAQMAELRAILQAVLALLRERGNGH